MRYPVSEMQSRYASPCTRSQGLWMNDAHTITTKYTTTAMSTVRTSAPTTRMAEV